LGGRKGIRPAKKLSGAVLALAGVVICLERGADLHMAQLMPLPLTVSGFSKIQIGFAFLVPAHPGSPRQTAIKRMCVSVCVQPSTAAVNVTLLAFAAAAPCCCAPCCSLAVAAKRPMLSINISVASDRP